MKLIYISQGNVPSNWAHSIQMMKMAQAYFSLTADFEFVIQGSIGTRLSVSKSYIYKWYGILKPFPLKIIYTSRKLRRTNIFSSDYYPYFYEKAIAYAKTQAPCIVYTRDFHVAKLAVEANLPVILERHNGNTHPRFHLFKEIAGSPFLIGMVTNTEKYKEEFTAEGLIPEKILVVQNGVELEEYNHLAAKNVLRKKLKLSSDQFIATYCGQLYEYKGVDTIIESARLLPEVCFLIIGGWPKDVEKYTQMAQGIKNIKFLGFTENRLIPQYLKASDVLLFPNSSKSPHTWLTPLKLMEYMASGVPIIATDIPGFAHILYADKNVSLAKPDDPLSLAEKIKFVRNNQNYSDMIAAQARKDVEVYTWDNRARNILQHLCPELIKKD